MTHTHPLDTSPYAVAEYTAVAVNGDDYYVADLRSSRVFRLSGLAALAWEWASGSLPLDEVRAALEPVSDEVPAHELLYQCCQTLAAEGLLVRSDEADDPGPRILTPPSDTNSG